MKKIIILNIYAIFFIVCSINGFSQEPFSVINKMFANIKSMKSLQYTLDSRERVKWKIYHEISDFKIIKQPFSIYIYQHSPVKGVEVLYIAGANNRKARVNPAGFPWVTLNLNPEGSLMLDKHHHPLYEGGFDYTASILEYLLNKYKQQRQRLIVNNGPAIIHGMDCYHYTIINPDYRMTGYTVGIDETPLTIARKLKINYFCIMENNPHVKGLGVIVPGTRLILPNDYASKMELYIHREKFYPVYIKIYDLKGIYEEYTFTNVTINPVFKNEVFSPDNPQYGF